MEHEFTLKIKLRSIDADDDEIVERLGEAGCTDAIVGRGMAGHIAIQFMREAVSAEEAVLSAIADVKAATDASLVSACVISCWLIPLPLEAWRSLPRNMTKMNDSAAF